MGYIKYTFDPIYVSRVVPTGSDTPIYNQMVAEGLWPQGFIEPAKFRRILDKEIDRWSPLCERLKASGD